MNPRALRLLAAASAALLLVPASHTVPRAAEHSDTPEPVQEDPQAIEQRRFDAMKDLPEGVGKEITAIACTRCHDLGGLSAYRGYWNRAQWLAMVESMVKNGAVLDTGQVQVVTDYLTQHYGRTAAP